MYFNDFSALLLCEKNVLDIQINEMSIFFGSHREVFKILTESYYWSGVYMGRSTPNRPVCNPHYFLLFSM